MTKASDVKNDLIDQCAVAWWALYKKQNAYQRRQMITRLLKSAARLRTIKQLREWLRRMEGDA